MMSVLFLVTTALMTIDDAPVSPWWDAKVDASLVRSIERKPAWETMLLATKPDQRSGMAYLMTDLPLRDLQVLPPEILASNVALAYQVRAEVSWGARLPEPIFLDAVLPYANVTEPRDSLRKEFHDKYLALVKESQTPGEAGLKINQALFKDYNVTYNTRRIRTDQSSKETIAQGMATCTGLSIMLVEACRAVGVPARVAGINSWPGRGGNHTWAEIWDNGEWHFVGAAEPDPKGLDHAWFEVDASKAIKSVSRNSVYAVTYRPTGDFFPVVWNPQAKVNAENVTDRYTKGLTNPAVAPRVMVEVFGKDKERVESEVTILDLKTGETRLRGKSLGPQSDINLHLSMPAREGGKFLIIARYQGQSALGFASLSIADTVVKLVLGRSDETLASLLSDRFGTDGPKQDLAKKLLAAIPFDHDHRATATAAFQASARHDPLRKEFDSNTVTTSNRTSPYLWREVGIKPERGWGLVIAMHGGGGAPKRVNDSQWESMFKTYYKEHPEAGGYLYLALRAPNDEWNGFYDDAICPLIDRLILQFVLFGKVNPDQVVILGASHGGYGAFVIGPKTPDRFSAIHASASAPTPGETLGENLRNTHFTFMVGEKDVAYGRADRCQEFAKEFEAWRKENGGYEGGFEWKPGVGHSVPDRDKVAELLKVGLRNPWPKRVIWVQSDDVIQHFYYIEASKPRDKSRIDVSVVDNTIKVQSDTKDDLALWLDQELVDLTKPVTIERVGGKSVTLTPNPTLETYCSGLETRGDPHLAAPVRVLVPGR